MEKSLPYDEIIDVPSRRVKIFDNKRTEIKKLELVATNGHT